MLKKTFYTFLAIGAVITIVVLSSGFMSTANAAEASVENAVETPAFVGSWVAGSVRQGDGRTLNPGTGDWISGRTSTGRYWVDVDAYSSQAPIMVVTPIDDVGGQSADNLITTYNHDHARGKVYIACTDKATGKLQDTNFSFIIYVK